MSDLISRQTVLGLKTIAPIAPVMNGEAVHYEEVVFVRDLEKLPSVEPEKCGDCIEKQKAISELQPPTDDWENYADRLYDLAYLSGYNDGLIAKGNRDDNV